jgi:YHS domain-containing protein
MLRGLLYALIGLFLITIVRMFVGVIFKGIGEMLQPSEQETASHHPGSAPNVATGGELKRDPVCGTFVPVTTSVKKTVHGELVHFCSADCRDKYAG